MILQQVVVGAAVVAVVGPLAYAVWDRNSPLRIESVDVLSPQVAPGQPLIWNTKFYRARECAVRLESHIIDGDRVTYDYAPVDYISTGAVGEDERTLSEVVPQGAGPGPGEYYRYGEYKCNWAHELLPIKVQLFHLKFTITKPKEQS